VKPVAVLDSSVVVSGIGWSGGDARKVLVLLARRGFVSLRTPWLTAEWLCNASCFPVRRPEDLIRGWSGASAPRAWSREDAVAHCGTDGSWASITLGNCGAPGS